MKIFPKTPIGTFALMLCFGGMVAAAEPQRIVSAGGSMTELLYAFGLQQRVIAVDSSSYFPPEAKQKPQIGYFRRMSTEGVLSLKPDLLIGSNGAGPDEVLKQLQQAGVAVKVFKQDQYTLQSWEQMVRAVGVYLQVEQQAEALIVKVLKAVEQAKQNKGQAHRTIFIMGLGDRGPVVAGRNTVPDMLFNLLGLENLAAEVDGFKPFNNEQLIKSEPDFIVMPSHVVDRMGGVKAICEQQDIKLTTRNIGCHIMVMDALLALGFGSRLDQAVTTLDQYAKQL